ncbi:MAG: chorismate mutase [Coprococcus sp.]|nr:chorismate mutase [Coprococcus sp.]
MTLEEVRLNIDKVDKEIKALFQERMLLADNVARVKAETEDAIYKPDREETIISNLTGDVDDNIKMEYTALIKRIMEISRKYQYGRTLELRNCLGIDYETEEPEISNIAMVKPELYICQDYSKDCVIAVDDYQQVMELIENGEADAGMGVLEDISYGVSDALHEMLTNSRLYIYRCSIVEENGHHKKVVTFADRLVVKENHNRLKVMFVCKNKSGSLSSVLSMIADYGVNLMEIHSAPDRKENWNYRFYIELSGNLLVKEIQALVFQLKNETEEFHILGSYYCEG